MDPKDQTSETTDTTKVEDNADAKTTTHAHTETGSPSVEKSETVIEKKGDAASEQ